MKKMFLSFLIFSVVNLSGCDNDNKISNKNYDHSQIKSASITQKTQNIEYIQSLLKNTYNFNAGKVNDDLNKKIIVFFDPQCIHCSRLFLNSQVEDNKDINVIWIPVGFLNEKIYHREQQYLPLKILLKR